MKMFMEWIVAAGLLTGLSAFGAEELSRSILPYLHCIHPAEGMANEVGRDRRARRSGQPGGLSLPYSKSRKPNREKYHA